MFRFLTQSKERVGGAKTDVLIVHPPRAFLNRLDCLNEEEIKQLTTREIFAYFKIIDKVDSRADVRRMVRTV